MERGSGVAQAIGAVMRSPDKAMVLDPHWPKALRALEQEVTGCGRCPRLVAWREEVAAAKRRAYQNCEYWGRPVPSFGDAHARLVIIGLAPAAHGGNRTGRMFTGDRSGDFLYQALYENGFANQPESRSREDGLVLTDAFITAPVRCAPPDNKPSRDEVAECRRFFHRTLDFLTEARVVVALGSFAFSEYVRYLVDRKRLTSRSAFRFGHGALYATYAGGPKLLGCYHPSQQNTSTGKLTADMLRDIFRRAREVIG